MSELSEATLDWKGCRFLDPMGKVFEYEGEFYRAIYPHKVDYVQSLFQNGLIDRLVKKGLLIETQITDLKVKGYGLVLWHRRIPFLTQPKEWNREFLRDAALCGIDLNLELLPFGLGTIDFHCANIQQQRKGSPVWIDLGSICPLEQIGGGKWGLSELKKYYLHPLYLLSQKTNLRRTCRLLLADGGIDDDEFHDLTNTSISASSQNRKVLLEGNRTWLASLTFPKIPNTLWNNYQKESYITKFDPNTMDTRSKIVYSIIQDLRPKKMIDLSCNVGRFSLMAARMGAETYAVDLDEGAIEKLYDLAKKIEDPISVTVALRNLVLEQKNVVIRGDLALALALSHHLAISQMYPFSHIAKVFSSYATKALLTEFMPNGLGGTRPHPNPLPPGYTLVAFQKAFEPYFRKVEVINYPIPPKSSYRVFVLCSDRKGDNDQGGFSTSMSVARFNLDNQDGQINAICPHCGVRVYISDKGLWNCPVCGNNFHVEESPYGGFRSDSKITHSENRNHCRINKTSSRSERNNMKLTEQLNQKIEIADLFGEPEQLNESKGHADVKESSKESLTKVNALNRQGEDLFVKGDWEGALKSFTKALEIDPNFATGHNNLGVLYWQAGETKKALEHSKKALEINPNNRDAIWNCAEVFKSLRRFNDVRNIYSSYLERNPGDDEIARALANLDSKEGIDRRNKDDRIAITCLHCKEMLHVTHKGQWSCPCCKNHFVC